MRIPIVPLLALVILAGGASLRAQTTYRDPQGRFGIAVPAGWTTDAQGDGVRLDRGTVFAVVTPFEGAASGQDVVISLLNQYGSQWKNFSEVTHGNHPIAGQPGAFAVFRGLNPKGVPSTLRLAGVARGNAAWALIISAPDRDYAAAQASIESLERGFTFGDRQQSPALATGGASKARTVAGVALRELESGEAGRLGLRTAGGAMVGAVAPGGPAERVGVKAGDVIVSAGGRQISHAAEFGQLVQMHQPGEQFDIVVVREGKPRQLELVLAGAPGGPGGDQQSPPQTAMAPADQETTRSAPSRASNAGGSGYYRMHMAQIIDREGFGQPVEVARLLIPADWKFESSVKWVASPGCPANMVQIYARASSPDGLSGLDVFTPHAWQWNDDPMARQVAAQSQQSGAGGCSMSPPVSAVDFIRQAVIPKFRSGARIVSAEPLPRVSQAAQQNLQTQYASYVQAGLMTGMKADAGRVKVVSQVNGREVEEWISGTVLLTISRSMSATAAMNGGMAQVNAYSLVATDLVATRAPAGELESKAKLYGTIVASVRPNQQWSQAYQQVIANINGAAIQGAVDRSRIWTQHSNEMNQMITQNYQNQQAVQDRVAEGYDQSIRGVETFVDPSSRERVELSSGFQQAWSNGQGEYILSDDPNFNPSVTLRENWTEMQRPGNR